MKKRFSGRAVTIILIAALLTGMAVLFYPGLADMWNSRTMTRAVASYEESVGAMSGEESEAYLEAAMEYNELLFERGSAAALARPEILEGYEEILDITGTGIMGYVTIGRMGIELPVYHGTDANVLSLGAGHLKGSSFPVGGENTHSVISAHRGLPSALLFTHLDRMEEGDLFCVTVLTETYTYEVDRISIVEPTEFEELYIEPGADYCTLMTCTPYGINTHRLLVRGVRTDGAAHIRVEPEAYRVNSLLAAFFIAIPLLAALLAWVPVSTRKRKKQ